MEKRTNPEVHKNFLKSTNLEFSMPILDQMRSVTVSPKNQKNRRFLRVK